MGRDGDGGRRGYAGNAVDINRITKKSKFRTFYYFLFCLCEVREVGRAWLGNGRCWQASGSNYFHM